MDHPIAFFITSKRNWFKTQSTELCRSMSRYHSYLNSAVQILAQYNGEEPFASYLKKYFAQHRKYGSKDRKWVSHLCYCYFRLGKSAISIPVEERLLMAAFLCSTQSNELLAALKPAWHERTGLSTDDKISVLNQEEYRAIYAITDVFPWAHELSEGIDHEKFCSSFLIQPDLFLRIRPGRAGQVTQKLQNAGIDFNLPGENCLIISNATKIDQVIELDKEAVVQDYSSQKVGDFLLPLGPAQPSFSLWDCCAASGGKSILARDILGNVQLTVSDIRESILHNLKNRFERAGIKNYTSFVADLSKENFKQGGKVSGLSYDLVICDAPCTGSGTWSRTPEQLYYFNEDKIAGYADLQKRIVTNVNSHIKPGGYLLYITCSVFRKENEEVVDYIKNTLGLHLTGSKVLQGYSDKADTMFAALLQKTL